MSPSSSAIGNRHPAVREQSGTQQIHFGGRNPTDSGPRNKEGKHHPPPIKRCGGFLEVSLPIIHVKSAPNNHLTNSGKPRNCTWSAHSGGIMVTLRQRAVTRNMCVQTTVYSELLCHVSQRVSAPWAKKLATSGRGRKPEVWIRRGPEPISQ